jgi:hypothetical protein
MQRDIHKLADWLVKVTREGIAIESKILEWKKSEEKLAATVPQTKAG